LGLADQISAAQAEELVEVPIDQICLWERGIIRLHEADEASPRILRLSIDSKGIRKVERLLECTDPRRKADGCFAFIIEDEEVLRGVIAQFKVFLHPLSKDSDCLQLDRMAFYALSCQPALVASGFGIQLVL
jgi:hypothetical protein